MIQANLKRYWGEDKIEIRFKIRGAKTICRIEGSSAKTTSVTFDEMLNSPKGYEEIMKIT